MKKTGTELTVHQALLKMQQWCAYQERCQQETRDKLYSLKLKTEDVEHILSLLIADNFVNEERFAKAFAGGKFRIKKWGRLKIKAGLKEKRVSEYCIRKAMNEIDQEEYMNCLNKLIRDKKKQTPEKNKIRKALRLLRYAASKGYEHELIMEILNEDN